MKLVPLSRRSSERYPFQNFQKGRGPEFTKVLSDKWLLWWRISPLNRGGRNGETIRPSNHLKEKSLGEREIYFVKWPPHSPANANGQFSHNAKVCQMSDRNGDKSIKNFREWSSSFCPLEAQDQFLQIFKQENATRRKFRNAPTVLPIILPIRLARYSREESFDRKHI